MTRAIGWMCVLVCAQGCFLMHGTEDEGDVIDSSGRALLSDDDDWFKPGLGSGRGDAEATRRAIEWLEEGLVAPRIQICGTHPEMDSIDENWRNLDRIRTRTVRAQMECAGELRALLVDQDIVVLEYVTRAWGSEAGDWTEDDLDAAWEFFEDGGRVAVLDDLGEVTPFFARFNVDPTTLDTADAYGDVTLMNVADAGRPIGRAVLLADPR